MVRLQRLRYLRERKALSQRELAERSGVNRVTIVRLETGAQEPHPRTTRRLAEALGVEPADLMGPEDDESTETRAA
jgi:transcriptional regulator with XRE-family HTH domain